jgi:hypothetical protein
MDMSWMYKARRTEDYFLGELKKFIESAEKHARSEKTQRIHCPCKICKNIRVFSDTTIIRSHVLVCGFVDNYIIWMYHGEKAPPSTENPIDEIIQDAEFNRLFDAYDDFDDAGSNDEDVGGGCSDDVNGGHRWWRQKGPLVPIGATNRD